MSSPVTCHATALALLARREDEANALALELRAARRRLGAAASQAAALEHALRALTGCLVLRDESLAAIGDMAQDLIERQLAQIAELAAQERAAAGDP